MHMCVTVVVCMCTPCTRADISSTWGSFLSCSGTALCCFLLPGMHACTTLLGNPCWRAPCLILFRPSSLAPRILLNAQAFLNLPIEAHGSWYPAQAEARRQLFPGAHLWQPYPLKEQSHLRDVPSITKEQLLPQMASQQEALCFFSVWPDASGEPAVSGTGCIAKHSSAPMASEVAVHLQQESI